MILTPLDKAQAINNDFGNPVAAGGIPQRGATNYRGAIAEIGAGQEVARLFFEALGSSNTIVKTMSAYGKGCSDAIYGRCVSYISETRLESIVEHDYSLLLTRSLADDEKPKDQQLRYFTFANTVDINKNGWAAVRVQTTGCALSDDVHNAREFRVHFEILAKDKVTKIKIVGALGINLIHGALLAASERKLSNESLILALMENIETADLRIDVIDIRKMKVRVDRSSSDQPKLSIEQVEKDRFGVLSRDMCIELVKTSTVRCASFKRSNSAAIRSYDTVQKGKYLVLTSSACHTDGLPLETEMLRCANDAFYDFLSTNGKPPKPSDILTAIHLPILGTLPVDRDLSRQYIYISRVDEPEHNRKQRQELLKDTTTEEIASRVERIVGTNSVALLSEFSATSEIIKFLRAKTRLGVEPMLSQEIALVLRADQLVMFLINVEERFKDRESLEIIGSIIRRKTRMFIYPCAHSRIFESCTLYGTSIDKAFTQDALKKRSTRQTHRVTIEHLKNGLLQRYSALLAYMASAECIYDLNPDTDDFIDYPLRPQIQ